VIAHVLSAGNAPAETIDAIPQCGLDYCDQCSDCLDCHAEDPCFGDVDTPPSGQHVWIVYPEEAAAFKKRILATPREDT
jgi:hypothetical protein